MRGWGLRRVPVVDRAGALVGLVALDDVLSLLAEELTVVGEVLSRQMPPRRHLEELLQLGRPGERGAGGEQQHLGYLAES